MTTRLRKPNDPLELMQTTRRDLEPLYEAWSDVWIVGSADAIQAGDAVIERAARVVGAATINVSTAADSRSGRSPTWRRSRPK